MGPAFPDGDYVCSDDMSEVLDYYQALPQQERLHDSRNTGPNAIAKRVELQEKLKEKEANAQRLQRDIAELQKTYAQEAAEIEVIRQQLRVLERPAALPAASGGINYQTDRFDWDGMILAKAQKVFGIPQFRLCQRGVCNASMDGRDIVCVMPTGGGKSLTYQLPALLTPGLTVVISPLISLIEDQVMNLRKHNVEAVKLLGSMNNAELNDIMDRLAHGTRDIKILYLTPEKLVKSPKLQKLLSDLNEDRKLARFVIDEAHCVSSYGHDFREDYKRLHILRTNYPSVPIMALSATCPPRVLDDIVKILRLGPICPGENSLTHGTVYFSAPLYRKNLHYTVLRKPSGKTEMLKIMVEWILEHHPGESGIVYCFSRNDAQTVADKLMELSGNKIRTGTYHSSVDDEAKHKLHEDWRSGRVHVVCATIAFGLGIDKGDVRFVIHHTIPKSIEGYYQESGRAGRDGKDADCVLYYRPQDASHIAGMVMNSKAIDALDKLHELLTFVQDLQNCRKHLFANYFQHLWQLSMTSWTTEDSNALERCGHCDNCIRQAAPTHTFRTEDITVPVWQIIRIVGETQRLGAKVTMASLTQLVRTKVKAEVEVKRGRGKQKVQLNLQDLCGGPVDAKMFSAEDVERILVFLLVHKYLREHSVASRYGANVYMHLGGHATIFTRIESQDEVVIQKETRKIKMMFPSKPKPEKEKATRKKGTGGERSGVKTLKSRAGDTDSSLVPSKRTANGKGKAKSREILSSDEDADDEDHGGDGDDAGNNGGHAGADSSDDDMYEDDDNEERPRNLSGESTVPYPTPSGGSSSSRFTSGRNGGSGARGSRSGAATETVPSTVRERSVIEITDSDDELNESWESNLLGRKVSKPAKKRARRSANDDDEEEDSDVPILLSS